MSALEFSQLLGNYGEFVGAIAIIVTLVYLALQLRQNTKSVNSNNNNTVMQGFNVINATMFADPELVRIWYGGLEAPESLQTNEQHQFIRMNHSLLNVYRNLYYQYLDGTFPEASWLPWAWEVKLVMKTPGMSFFRSRSETYDDLFEYVEQMPDVAPAKRRKTAA